MQKRGAQIVLIRKPITRQNLRLQNDHKYYPTRAHTLNVNMVIMIEFHTIYYYCIKYRRKSPKYKQLAMD